MKKGPMKNWRYKFVGRKGPGWDKENNFVSELTTRLLKHPNNTYLKSWREYYRKFVQGFQWQMFSREVFSYEGAGDVNFVNFSDESLSTRFRSTVNYLKVLILVAVARHIKNQPVVSTEPLTGDAKDIDSAKAAGMMLDRLWQKEIYNLLGVEISALFNAAIDDISWLYAEWNDTLYRRISKKGEEQVGDLEISCLTADQVYFLTQNATDYFQMREVVIVRSMEVAILKQEYPEFADLIVSGGMKLKSPGVIGIENRNWDDELVEVWDYWAKPTKEYPNGRFQRIIGGDILVTGIDTPNLLYDAGFPVEYALPVVPIRWDWLGGKMNGMSAVHDLISPQRDINVVESQIQGNIELTSGIKIVFPMGRAPKDEDWHNMAQIVECDMSNGTPMTLGGSPVAAYVPQSIDRKVRQMQDLLGIHEISQGGIPAGMGRPSGYALDRVADHEGIRHGPNLMNLEQSLLIFSRLCLLFFRNFYKENRLLKCIGERGGWLLKSFLGSDLDGDFEAVLRPASLLNRALTQRIESLFQIWDRGILHGKYSFDPAERKAAAEMLKLLEFGSTKVDVVGELQRSRASAMLEAMRAGEKPPILNIEDPLIFSEVFEEFVLTEAFSELSDDIKEAILRRLEVYQSWMEPQGAPQEGAPVSDEMSPTQQGEAMSMGGMAATPPPGADELVGGIGEER
jgi:hypothetical protein